jgi:metal-responsive CopG/Arc/MetJ family transcriptional regulator
MGEMKVTLEMPESLHARLRERAAREGVSMRSLVVEALERDYPQQESQKGRRVTGPMVRVKGKLGPRFPVDETPHDLILG